jgi:hypothetical protein
LVKDFFAENIVTTLEHPPVSPGLSAVAFYLLCRMQSSLKGQRFCDATEIMMNATEEPKRFLQSGFQECFQHLYSRW